jgi:hypothetical protein
MPGSRTVEDKLNPRVGLIVHVDESGADPATTALGIVEDGSVEYDFGEENEDFNPFGDTRIEVDPSTENPKVSFTIGRAIGTGSDDTALDLLGIRDDSNDGKYVRDSGRVWDTDISLEVWYFETDGVSGTPDVADAFEDVRWDISGSAEDGNVLSSEITGHVQGDFYLDTTPTEEPA